MRKLIYIFFLFSLPVSSQSAFPSAEGAAASTTSGGRGGTVLHVTSLLDDGSSGTLRWAINQTGARTIVFDVSGEITMNNTWYFSGASLSNLTIAGQTAPEGGITVRGHPWYFNNVDNIIIRYIRVRMDRDIPGVLALSSFVTESCENVILDHCSVSYGMDENVTLWDDGTNPSGNHTVQRSIIGEGKNGLVIGSSTSGSRELLSGDITISKNLIGWGHRTPNTSGNGQFDIINNFIYGWQFRLTTGGAGNQINHINNFYRPNNVTTQAVSGDGSGNLTVWNNMIDPPTGALIYTSGNEYEGYSFMNADDWNAWRTFGDYANQPAEGTYRSGTQLTLLGSTAIESTAWVRDSLLDDVGANKYLNADGTWGTYIDTNDQAYISNADSGTDTLSSFQNGYWQHRWYVTEPQIDLPFPTIPNNTRAGSYDTDGDGMADVWETATFGDLTRDGTGDLDTDGYTDLEEFLNVVDEPGSVPSNIGKVIKARGGRVKVNGKFMRIKTN